MQPVVKYLGPITRLRKNITIETDKMTQANQSGNTNTDLFNSLRIPDAIKDLPHFNGNPRLLYEFINNVEEILLYIQSADSTPYGKILLRAIRNKIEGEANEILNMYGTPLNWDMIKGNLILHYSDKRSETSLIKDLHNVRQANRTIQQFYSDIIEIQSALCNNILIHEKDQNVISSKKELFADMCLNTFLSGLREPLGSSIRAMQPKSLASALSFCLKEQNIYYRQSTFYKQPYRTDNFRNPQQYDQNPIQQYRPNNHASNYPQKRKFEGSETKFSRNYQTYASPNIIPKRENYNQPRNTFVKQSPSTQSRNFRQNEVHNFEQPTNSQYQTLDQFTPDQDATNIDDSQNFHFTSTHQQGT